MTKLKPCPFCGGKAVLRAANYSVFEDSYQKATIECECCGIRTPYMNHFLEKEREMLVSLWNRRVNNA